MENEAAFVAVAEEIMMIELPGPITLTSAVAPGATSYTDNSGTGNNTTLAYDVTPIAGAAIGTPVSAYTVIGTLATANTPRLTGALVATPTGPGDRVTVAWTAPGNGTAQAAIGGYEVQRCAGSTCSNFVKLTGSAVNTAGTVDGRGTLNFVDTSVARRTTYRYRMRVVGGAGTGAVGSFSGTAILTTQ